MVQAIYHVDAFTDRPFAGNPAAVCPLPAPVPEAWMQALAGELNLAETAFLWPEGDGFRLRWFTPIEEEKLCGHATLASAHVLWQTGQLRSDQQARFHTLSGLLTANQRGDWIEMSFPALPPEPVALPAGLAQALGVAPLHVSRSALDYVVEVAGEAAVRTLQPDYALLGRWPVRGVIVTARSAAPEYDFVSRFFAAGTGEDPVTGSAHCALAPYWAPRLGKTELIGYQASPRGGAVRARLAGDRVILSGQAVTVLVGEFVHRIGNE
jgi:PhzF family phenazine biosynthesis protein